MVKLGNLKFLMFLFSHQHEINLWSLIALFFLLLHPCYFVIWVTKMHEQTIPSVRKKVNDSPALVKLLEFLYNFRF